MDFMTINPKKFDETKFENLLFI